MKYFERNLGFISSEEQNRLAKTRVLVCGVGGMGGVAAEVLVRLGFGKLRLADFDEFEPSNTNRQIHCSTVTYGQNKASSLSDAFSEINPDIEVDAYTEGVTLSNVESLLEGVDVVVNGMDKMRSSLILERTARTKNLPIVDAWLTPFASVFVIRPESPHWEDYLDLPTRGIPLSELTDELCREAVRREADYTLSHGWPYDYIDRELVEKVLDETVPRPSFAIPVWLSGVMMANEVYKLVLGLPTTDHVGVIYDQYRHTVLPRNPRITS